jgi:hypothetical protein
MLDLYMLTPRTAIPSFVSPEAWPGLLWQIKLIWAAQLGAGGLAAEHRGELVDHGVLRCSRCQRTNPRMSLAPNSGFLPSSRS